MTAGIGQKLAARIPIPIGWLNVASDLREVYAVFEMISHTAKHSLSHTHISIFSFCDLNVAAGVPVWIN